MKQHSLQDITNLPSSIAWEDINIDIDSTDIQDQEDRNLFETPDPMESNYDYNSY